MKTEKEKKTEKSNKGYERETLKKYNGTKKILAASVAWPTASASDEACVFVTARSQCSSDSAWRPSKTSSASLTQSPPLHLFIHYNEDPPPA